MVVESENIDQIEISRSVLILLFERCICMVIILTIEKQTRIVALKRKKSIEFKKKNKL